MINLTATILLCVLYRGSVAVIMINICDNNATAIWGFRLQPTIVARMSEFEQCLGHNHT